MPLCTHTLGLPCPLKHWQAAKLSRRTIHPHSSLQYLGEREVFARGRYNALLTAAEFVGLDVLKRYWTERYGWGAPCSCKLC